jgi:hypothetical protein
MGVTSSAWAAGWATQPMTGPSGPSNAALTSVSCASATSCMAVGTSDYGFDHLGINLLGPIATFAERWDGSSWVVLPTPPAGANPTLFSLSCVSATFCVAVGSTQTGGRQSVAGLGAGGRNPRPLLEVWNGSAWAARVTPISAARGGALSGVSCVSTRFCMAVGSSGLIWDGTSWRQIKLPAVKYGTSLTATSCAAAGECTAVGWYNANRTGVAELRPLAARWHGGRWTVSRPAPERDRYRGRLYSNDTWLTGVSCPSRSSCLATGLALRTQNFYPQGGFAVRWNGSRWSTATAGIAHNSPLNGVSCVSANECFAAGQYDPRTITSPTTQQPLLEHWTSNRWSRVPIPRVATLTNRTWTTDNVLDPDFFGISCVVATGCTAVGAQPQGGASAALALSDLPAASQSTVPAR